MLNQEEPITIHDYLHLPSEQIGKGISPPHQEIRSSLIVPIRFREHAAGIIHLHSKDPGKYDDTAIEIASSLATQATIAIGNAQRYQVQVQQTDLLRRREETLDKILVASVYLLKDQPLKKALEAIAVGIQESTPFNVVTIGVFNRHERSITPTVCIGIDLETDGKLRDQTRSWEIIEQLLKADYRYGHIYFIPQDLKPISLPDSYSSSRINGLNRESSSIYRWHSDDQLLIPLVRENGEPLGLISVQEPRNCLRPDRPTIDTLEIFGSQAALTIENHQRHEELIENFKV
jgi:GAF domain-containing protein